MKENLWIYTFEFAGIKKMGGLGEVPANQIKWLSDNYNITVFMPSHGVINDPKIKEKLQLKKLDIECICKINALDLELGDKEEDVHILYYEGNINGNKTVLLSGKNKFTSEILDDIEVYSPETLLGKFILFSLGMKYYTAKILQEFPDKRPKIIHCHDYHPVPALISSRQQFLKNNFDVATVITIHLMTWPRQSLDFLFKCGVEDIPMDIFIGDRHENMNMKELYEFCRGNENIEPTLEKIGVYFADLVTSVSEDYLKADIVARLGGGWINGKSDYFWNGCDWDYEKNFENIKSNFENQLREFDSMHPFDRTTMREFFLTKALGEMLPNEPDNDSQKIKDFFSTSLIEKPYIANKDGTFSGKVLPFKEDGPMVIMTGRISKQKGIDTLLSAVPMVNRVYPDAKFVMFLIPTEFAIKEIESYLEILKDNISNVRMVFGKVFSLYTLLHLSADVYCAPSRWEPFGIIALEAMASKIPVIATMTGGLQESVIDITKDQENGTGFLIPIDDTEKLAENLINLISIIKLDELNAQGKLTEDSLQKLTSNINNESLRDYLLKNPSYGTMIRKNCYNRVETAFRWRNVSQKLIKIYNQALKNREKPKILKSKKK